MKKGKCNLDDFFTKRAESCFAMASVSDGISIGFQFCLGFLFAQNSRDIMEASGSCYISLFILMRQ